MSSHSSKSGSIVDDIADDESTTEKEKPPFVHIHAPPDFMDGRPLVVNTKVKESLAQKAVSASHCDKTNQHKEDEWFPSCFCPLSNRFASMFDRFDKFRKAPKYSTGQSMEERLKGIRHY